MLCCLLTALLCTRLAACSALARYLADMSLISHDALAFAPPALAAAALATAAAYFARPPPPPECLAGYGYDELRPAAECLCAAARLTKARP